MEFQTSLNKKDIKDSYWPGDGTNVVSHISKYLQITPISNCDYIKQILSVANWSPTLGEYSVIKNIQMALDIWGKYARLSFHRSQDNNADIIVAFGTGYHGDR